MEKKSSTDSAVWAPVLLGVLSLVGIAAVFIFSRLNESRPPLATAPTETPFKYIYLGTEPAISTLTPAPTPTPIVIEPVDLSDMTRDSLPSFVTPAPSAVKATRSPSPRTSTPTVTETLLAVLSKFDDTYYEFLYDGSWAAQSNVNDVHQGTLHISLKVGNSVSFTFVGQQVIVSYQAGPSLGIASINLDGYIIDVSQADNTTRLKEWRSPLLVKGTHTLVITHISGGSINLDSVIVPDVSTPTPTPTHTTSPED